MMKIFELLIIGNDFGVKRGKLSCNCYVGRKGSWFWDS